MTPQEIRFRLVQFSKKRITRKSSVGFFPEKEFKTDSKNLLEVEELSPQVYSNLFNIFGIPLDYSKPINWHADIKTGREFPRIFSHSINVRLTEGISAKRVWEVNRLQFLPKIAMQFRYTGDRKYLELFQSIIESWIENNPFLIGINWHSNIEINLRLIIWFICWEILKVNELIKEDSQFEKFVDKLWIPEIYLHCFYSYRNPSKYSSANNHLIAEYAGLFIASSYWKFQESEKWNNYAKKGLEGEIVRQHSENGINLEQAYEYIQFVTDLFLLSLIVGERSNNPFSETYKNTLKKIMYYISNSLNENGNYTKYGDSDDGKVFIIDENPSFNNFNSLLTSGAIIFKDSYLKTDSVQFDLKNTLLFGRKGKDVYDSLSNLHAKASSQFYPKEGHFVFRKKEKNKETFLHFNAAPLGYLSIAAHGHADALSFTLNVDGFPLLVDLGTYTYHTEPEWRQYFMGTLAHNTIRINGMDQARLAGPTMWTKHYKCTILNVHQSEEVESVKASHDGYNHIGLDHIREIFFYRKENLIELKDELIVNNSRNYYVEFPLHLHPSVSIQLPKNNSTNNQYKLSHESGPKVEVEIDKKFHHEIIKGSTDPILGWYSASFDNKELTNVIYSTASIKESIQFTTSIRIRT